MPATSLDAPGYFRNNQGREEGGGAARGPVEGRLRVSLGIPESAAHWLGCRARGRMSSALCGTGDHLQVGGGLRRSSSTRKKDGALCPAGGGEGVGKGEDGPRMTDGDSQGWWWREGFRLLGCSASVGRLVGDRRRRFNRAEWGWVLLRMPSSFLTVLLLGLT